MYLKAEIWTYLKTIKIIRLRPSSIEIKSITIKSGGYANDVCGCKSTHPFVMFGLNIPDWEMNFLNAAVKIVPTDCRVTQEVLNEPNTELITTLQI